MAISNIAAPAQKHATDDAVYTALFEIKKHPNLNCKWNSFKKRQRNSEVNEKLPLFNLYPPPTVWLGLSTQSVVSGQFLEDRHCFALGTEDVNLAFNDYVEKLLQPNQAKLS